MDYVLAGFVIACLILGFVSLGVLMFLGFRFLMLKLDEREEQIKRSVSAYIET